MQRLDIETEDLFSAFSKDPQVEAISFGPDDSPLHRVVTIILYSNSSVGRETLLDPDHLARYNYRMGQFTALLTAARKNER